MTKLLERTVLKKCSLLHNIIFCEYFSSMSSCCHEQHGSIHMLILLGFLKEKMF